jgi:hypothetical protein
LATEKSEQRLMQREKGCVAMILKLRTKILLVVLCSVVGLTLFLYWNVAPSTLEARMISKTNDFLAAIDRGDRLAILRQTVTEQDLLEELEDAGPGVVAGSVKLPPSAILAQRPAARQPESEIHNAWDWDVMSDLSRRLRNPVFYGVWADPYDPRLSFDFDCRGVAGRCMEHVAFLFTARATKLETYVPFWNDSVGRRLWQETYGKGLDSKRCDHRCPRFQE